MKTLLKLSPLCALLLSIGSFVLLMVTPALTNTYTVLGKTITDFYSAFAVIFGKGQASLLSVLVDYEGTLAWSALLAWIFVGAAALLLLISFIGALLKNKSAKKFSGLIALLSAGLLLAAGIFLFFTKAAFYGANGLSTNDSYQLGAGWIIAAILALAGGLFSLLPATLTIISKK